MSPAAEMTVYSAAAGLCVMCFGYYVWSLYSDYMTGRRSGQVASGGEATSAVFRMLKPFARLFGHLISSGITRLQQRFGKEGPFVHLVSLRVKLQRLLIAAGSPEGLTADEMLGLVCFSIVAWTIGGVFVCVLLESTLPILIMFMIGVAQPFMWLNKQLVKRRNDIRRLLPYSLDLLTLSVEAGLDFTSALARMVPKLEGTALADEFGALLRSIRLGASRSESLREMADRVNMGEVTSFTSSLVQADELGADLGPVLRVLAEQMRNDRSNRAEKKAMEAPVKILFPLIVFIFPTVFIIIFAPMGINYLSKLFD